MESSPERPDGTLARIDRCREAGEKIAAALRANPNMHQEHAAVLAGISRRTYFRWLDGEDDASLAFQALVLPAIYEQAEANREEAEKAIGSSENGSSAWAGWHKWLLEKRYRKIYGDLAQEVKLELTGANGGPVQLEAVTREQAESELLAALPELLQSNPVMAQAVIKALPADAVEKAIKGE